MWCIPARLCKVLPISRPPATSISNAHTSSPRWATKKYGVQLGHVKDTMITNLRFADDILLVGRSLPQIKQMIADIIEEGGNVGLELHPQKTKIQHNGIGYGSRVRSASVRGMNIEVMDPSSSNMYLGRALSLTEPHQTELDHRFRKGVGQIWIIQEI